MCGCSLKTERDFVVDIEVRRVRREERVRARMPRTREEALSRRELHGRRYAEPGERAATSRRAARR